MRGWPKLVLCESLSEPPHQNWSDIVALIGCKPGLNEYQCPCTCIVVLSESKWTLEGLQEGRQTKKSTSSDLTGSQHLKHISFALNKLANIWMQLDHCKMSVEKHTRPHKVCCTTYFAWRSNTDIYWY